MKLEIFYEKFANTPIDERFSVIDFSEGGMMTLSDLYNKLHKLDEQIQPYILKQQKLLKLADKYYMHKTKIKITLTP